MSGKFSVPLRNAAVSCSLSLLPVNVLARPQLKGLKLNVTAPAPGLHVSSSVKHLKASVFSLSAYNAQQQVTAFMSLSTIT